MPMPKRKLTQEVFVKMNEAYEAWDPQDRTAEELFAPFGISKQAFFAERRRRSMPPRHRAGTDAIQYAAQQPANMVQTVETLVGLLAEARLRIAQLEAELDKK